MSTIIQGLLWLTALLTLAGAASIHIVPRTHGILNAIQTGGPSMLYINGAGIVVGALTENLAGILTLAASAAWWLYWLRATNNVTAKTDGWPLRIFSSNLCIANTKIAAICETINKTKADIVITVETSDTLRAELQQKITNYTMLNTGTGQRGQMISIWTATNLDPDTYRSAEVTIGGDTLPGCKTWHDGKLVHIVGVHLHAPLNHKMMLHWEQEIGDMRDHAITCANEKIELIYAGDFNADTRRLRQLTNLLRDAGTASGRLLVRTWPVRWPYASKWRPKLVAVMCLDHALLSNGIGLRHYETTGMPGSDHKGIIIDVTM